MNISFLDAARFVNVREQEIPQPQIGEVLVKLSRVGICGSDIHLFSGHRPIPYPQTIGHEGLGIIDQLGEGVNSLTLGERVVIEPNIPCGKCSFCQQGRALICPNKRTIGLNSPGCFAEYVCVPEEFCWRVPEEISDADAMMIEPTAVVVHALFQSKAKPGDTIGVIGLGAIGMLLTDLAIALGFRVIVAELQEEKLRIASELGALISTGNSNNQGELWEKEKVQAVFECAGSARTVTLALELAPRGSQVLLLGLSEEMAHFQPLKFVREGIELVSSLIYQHPTDFERTINLIRRKIIQPGKFAGTSFSLSRIQDALELASKGEEIKVWINLTL